MVADVLIREFLARQSAVPFLWGRSDCCLFAADYVRAVTGRDPGEHLRGQYSDEDGAVATLDENGGLEGVMDLSEWARVNAPEEGDIAIVKYAPLGREEVLLPAIRVAGGWYHKCGHGGVAFSKLPEPQVIWRAA